MATLVCSPWASPAHHDQTPCCPLAIPSPTGQHVRLVLSGDIRHQLLRRKASAYPTALRREADTPREHCLIPSPGPDERKSELLPTGWEANKEVYTLRYKSTDDAHELLLKAIMVEDSMILNVMDRNSQKVADVTLAVADYINPEHLDDFHKVYKNTEELRTRIASGIITPLSGPAEKAKKEPEAEKDADVPRDYDPLRVLPRQPPGARAPSWPSPVSPFAVGGEDLDPLG
ncbi:proteasome inhibitor pi31 hypothetical protein [Limosa lapponica baueri]|uniref:Proteasome inhibitor PI31 subunit n=1 Tax=Limosa lapponica baueri TaxID=1758121 RepID=A0A2I0TEI3_LIMLA|nr:proteasome inhibitor pi31 hypothetical protein [Limosa lapponica baueri]